MRITQILKLLLLSGVLSGCWNLGIKGEAPGSLGNIDLLQSFIGQESESVVREFGIPDELLSDGDKQFMVYSAWSSGADIVMVGWIPVWAIHGEGKHTLHCLRFELSSNNAVKEYQFKSHHPVGVYPIMIASSSNCQEVFWSWNERTKLQKMTDFPSTWLEIDADFQEKAALEKAEKDTLKLVKLELEANKGNSDAQLKLFNEMRTAYPEEALRWLCESADLGNQEARFIMAKTYENSGYTGITKGDIQQNYKLAYVWHSLSGLYDEEDLQFFADRHLTAAELSDANNLLREWRPGQCEKDLGLVSYTE